MILVQSTYGDIRPQMFDADSSAMQDPRAVPFREGVECFVCRKPCRVEATACCMIHEACFSLWAHRDCLQGKVLADVLVDYYAAVSEIVHALTKHDGGA